MAGDQADYEHRMYLEERKLLIDLEWSQAKSFDQAMITLSAGALGLSIAFVREIAPDPEHKLALYLAWSGFILTLVSVLSSFLMSQFAAQRQRDILDNQQQGVDNSSRRNRLAGLTMVMNIFSIAVFVGGIASLAIFSALNLP